MTLTERIKHEARRAGFDAVGIARVADPSSDHDALGGLREWLRRGYEGAMTWMGRDPERRADPCRVLPGCRSVICVGMNYYTTDRADERPEHGRIARYAWGRDYHDVMGNRLRTLTETLRVVAPASQFRWYVDTGPVMEKVWAQRAGLGWIGKHGNLVSSRFGSWLLLGEILTTLALDPDESGVDLCGSCTLCIRACPTGAIVEPAVVDARQCISYLTIELPRTGDQAPAELQAAMGNRIFGCDDCLDVCPYNANETPTAEPAFRGTPLTLRPDLAHLAGMAAPHFESTFRGSPLRRPRHHGFLQNVAIARRNASAPALSATAPPASRESS